MPRWDILGLSWESLSAGGALGGSPLEHFLAVLPQLPGALEKAWPLQEASKREEKGGERSRSKATLSREQQPLCRNQVSLAQRPTTIPAKLGECAPGAIRSASWFYDREPRGGKNEFIRAAPASGKRWLCAARARPGGPGSPAPGATSMEGRRRHLLDPSLPHLSLRGAVHAGRLPAPCPGLGWKWR